MRLMRVVRTRRRESGNKTNHFKHRLEDGRLLSGGFVVFLVGGTNARATVVFLLQAVELRAFCAPEIISQ